MVNIWICDDRLARRAHVAVPCALIRDEVAREVAVRHADDIAVLARDRDVEHHVVFRRLQELLRRLARRCIECGRMGCEILRDTHMLADPSRKPVLLALDMSGNVIPDARVERPLRHEIAEARDKREQDADHDRQKQEFLSNPHDESIPSL